MPDRPHAGILKQPQMEAEPFASYVFGGLRFVRLTGGDRRRGRRLSECFRIGREALAQSLD